MNERNSLARMDERLYWQREPGFFERALSGLSEVWGDVSGATARAECRALTRQVKVLEGKLSAAEEKLSAECAALPDQVDAAVADGVAAAVEPLARKVALVMEVQRQTTALLHQSVATVQEMSDAARAQMSAATEAFDTRFDALAAQLEAMPEAWRADVMAMLDALRQSQDAANALLHGAEAFAASVSRTIEDV